MQTLFETALFSPRLQYFTIYLVHNVAKIAHRDIKP